MIDKARLEITNLEKISNSRDIRDLGELSKIERFLGSAISKLQNINPSAASKLEIELQEVRQIKALELRKDRLIDITRKHIINGELSLPK